MVWWMAILSLSASWRCDHPKVAEYHQQMTKSVFLYLCTKSLWIQSEMKSVSGLLSVFVQTGLSKQSRLRSDTPECVIWSGSTLFATHPAIFRHNNLLLFTLIYTPPISYWLILKKMFIAFTHKTSHCHSNKYHFSVVVVVAVVFSVRNYRKIWQKKKKTTHTHTLTQNS